MKPYPKNIYQTAALIQKYKDAGLVITDDQKVETALNEIGFYRLRGYSFHLYDNATKKYIPNVTFDTICHIYNFDMELRSLLFGMTCKIEVALRSRFSSRIKRYFGKTLHPFHQKLHVQQMYLSPTIMTTMMGRFPFGLLLK